MRVVIAPDCFTGTLTAAQAAAAMAEGWAHGAPHDRTLQLPLSDGGPGFIDVLEAGLADSGVESLAVPERSPAESEGSAWAGPECGEQTSATVVGPRAAEPDDDPARTLGERDLDELAHSVGRGARRVAFGGVEQVQAG